VFRAGHILAFQSGSMLAVADHHGSRLSQCEYTQQCAVKPTHRAPHDDLSQNWYRCSTVRDVGGETEGNLEASCQRRHLAVTTMDTTDRRNLSSSRRSQPPQKTPIVDHCDGSCASSRSVLPLACLQHAAPDDCFHGSSLASEAAVSLSGNFRSPHAAPRSSSTDFGVPSKYAEPALSRGYSTRTPPCNVRDVSRDRRLRSPEVGHNRLDFSTGRDCSVPPAPGSRSRSPTTYSCSESSDCRSSASYVSDDVGGRVLGCSMSVRSSAADQSAATCRKRQQQQQQGPSCSSSSMLFAEKLAKLRKLR